jgi:N6-adenosine-specific RNA methylase IME4
VATSGVPPLVGVELGEGSALSSAERERLASLEAVVARGLESFLEVARALLEIRERRLYRATHASFEAYVGERWGLARRTAYGYLEAARVAENVPAQAQLGISHLRALAPLPADEQRELAPRISSLTLAEARRVIREWRRQQRREWQEREPPPLPQGTFRTIVADPPLAYRPDFGDGLAADRYKTMELEELEAMPVADLAAPDSHLYLWIGATRVPDGLRLISAWGFEFVALLTWKKPSIGLGTWWRYQTEHLIHARRGALRTRPGLSNLFEARRSRHSEKPDEAYELIERASPGPYLDLFARRRRAGWTVWGDELDPAST